MATAVVVSSKSQLVRILKSHSSIFKRVMSTAEKVRSTASSGSQVYESKRAVTEYLLFHYGSKDDVIIRHKSSPDHALNFLKQSAELCARYVPVKDGRTPLFTYSWDNVFSYLNLLLEYNVLITNRFNLGIKAAVVVAVHWILVVL